MKINAISPTRSNEFGPVSRPQRRRRPTGGGALGRVLVAAGVALAGGLVSVAANPTPAPQTPPASHGGKALGKATAVAGVVKPTGLSKTAKLAVTPHIAVSASLPDSTCTLTAGTRSCDLYALAGSITVPVVGAVPIWGFSLSASGPATLPGPTLIGMQGETLSVRLHNSLPAAGGNLSLEIPESSAVPDTIGAAVGGMSTYTFNGLAPGTYIYEAGSTPNNPRQIAMGLTGMLVVRPSNWSTTLHTAYGDAASTFTAESPVELNEIDTSFNANPVTGDLHHFQPNVFLVNGVAFDRASPAAGSIPVSPGDQLLLRYADLGIKERSMTIANARQTELSADTHVLSVQPDLAAMYLNPVQTADALTTVDPTLPLNTLVPLYDQGHHFTIPGGGLGGMLTMLNVVNGLAGTAAGPVTSVTVTTTNATQNTTNDGTYDTTVTGTITSNTGATITGAEWFFDNSGAGGTGTAVPVTPTGAGTATFSFIVPATGPNSLATLLSNPSLGHVNGEHVFWVHGLDANGWGVVSGDTENVNISGPVVTHVTVHSTPTNGTTKPNDIDGSTNLVIIGTAVASLPDWVVNMVEVCIDAPCANGTGTQLPLATTAATSVGSLATAVTAGSPITQVTLQAGVTHLLPSGLGLILTNAAGNIDTITLSSDVSPGTTVLPIQSLAPTNSYAIGDPVTQAGGTANGPDAAVVAFAGSVAYSTPGPHTFFIHACEAPPPAPSPLPTTCPVNGRWGVANNAATTAQAPFVIDQVGPATSITKVDPDPNNGTQSGNGNVGFIDQERIDATITDVATGNSPISLGEVFVTQTRDPSTHAITTCGGTTAPAAADYGTGAEMVPVGGKWNVSPTQSATAYIPLADIRACPEGKVRFWVHGKDLAGNWGDFASYDMTLDKTPPVIDAATATPSSTTVALNIQAHDPVSGGVNSNIVQAEYFLTPCTPGAELGCFNDPGPGNGTQIPIGAPGTSINVTVTIPRPPHPSELFVRVKDAAGNWTTADLQAVDFTETNEHETVVPPAETPPNGYEDYGPVAKF
jgi:hypothetical protein